MITLRILPVAKDEYIRSDFFRSLHAHAAKEGSYETIEPDDSPALGSRIIITLPDNVLVLGKHWDDYVRFWLDNGKPIDLEFICYRLGLQSRGGQTEFSLIRAEY